MEIMKLFYFWSRYLICLILVTLCVGCIGDSAVNIDSNGVLRLSAKGTATLTPFQPLEKSGTPTAKPTLTPYPYPILWMDGSIPVGLRENVQLTGQARIAKTSDEANIELTATAKSNTTISEVQWIYALVAPFPCVIDDISLEDILHAWRGEQVTTFAGKPLMMSETTRNAFEILWGQPSDIGVKVVNEGELLDTSWAERPSWVIIPFEDLVPRWKVLRVDGISILDKAFDISSYPLKVTFSLAGEAQSFESQNQIILPSSNRDAGKLTIVVMTGVTALVRATADKMEKYGMTYPGLDIQNWLLEADFTHISNEVSFDPSCPDPNPVQQQTIFCSKPEYFELLDFIGADIIELTGNHEIDWGRSAYEFTLQMYQQHNISYYAGGMNIEEARQPLLIEHNGNRLAFIGCNLPGPPSVWATDSLSGVAACEDYGWIKEKIGQLRKDGYLPIVTLQHNEFYSLTSTPNQKKDFLPLIDAGAVLVSGSQAHYPNPFDFKDGYFVHYGLGNLFFDQMDAFIADGVQREFIDRHVFYDGKHISTEVLTAHLEDFARPRPMAQEERYAFLQEAFSASGW